MMMGNISVSSEAESLLQIISDPDKYKKRIADLAQRQKDAVDAEASLRAARDKANADLEVLNNKRTVLLEENANSSRMVAKQLADLKASQESFKKLSDGREVELRASEEASKQLHAKRLADVSEANRKSAESNEQKAAELAKREADLNAASNELARRSSAIDHREAAAGHALRAAQTAQTEGEKFRDKHQANYLKIKASLQSLTSVE